jgi:hypothetical protein
MLVSITSALPVWVELKLLSIWSHVHVLKIEMFQLSKHGHVSQGWAAPGRTITLQLILNSVSFTRAPEKELCFKAAKATLNFWHKLN